LKETDGVETWEIIIVGFPKFASASIPGVGDNRLLLELTLPSTQFIVDAGVTHA